MVTELRIQIEHLPISLRDIAAVIGLAAALRLSAWRGGTRLWIPSTDALLAEHELSQVLGREAARALAERYRGEHLWIPRAAAAARLARNELIRARYQAGEPAATLAIEYGLSDRCVWGIVRQARSRSR